MVVVTRAGRLREWSQGELRLYLRGHVNCGFGEFGNTDYLSRWGCNWPGYTHTMGTRIKDSNRKPILSKRQYLKGGWDCNINHYYNVPWANIESDELRFDNFTTPRNVSADQEFQVWFVEDFNWLQWGVQRKAENVRWGVRFVRLTPPWDVLFFHPPPPSPVKDGKNFLSALFEEKKPRRIHFFASPFKKKPRPPTFGGAFEEKIPTSQSKNRPSLAEGRGVRTKNGTSPWQLHATSFAVSQFR